MFGVGAGDKGFSAQIKSRIASQRTTPKNSPPTNCAFAEIFVISVKNLRNYAVAAFFTLRSRCIAANLNSQTMFLLSSLCSASQLKALYAALLLPSRGAR
jgi:hypothetical protein